MAYETFWRGDRERYGDRNRDRWRSTSGDWRNAGRERDYPGSRGWSPAGEYFADTPSASGRRIDYERNWENEGRNDYGDRDYYGDRVQGSAYRGRGPRGYRRSDARICEDVCDALTDDDRVDASMPEIEIRVA